MVGMKPEWISVVSFLCKWQRQTKNIA